MSGEEKNIVNFEGKNAQQKMKMIHFYARSIYELMVPGQSFDLSWPEKETVIVPGKLPKVERILIFRPDVHVQIKANPATKRED